jgi:hypothetical protein
LIASTGHELAQAPQSVHFAGSMTYLSAPSEMAPTGHSGWHAPQAMHSSEIVYGMTSHSFILDRWFLSTREIKIPLSIQVKVHNMTVR